MITPTVTQLRAMLERLEAQGLGNAPVWVDDAGGLWRTIYHVHTQRNSQATVCAVLDSREIERPRAHVAEKNMLVACDCGAAAGEPCRPSKGPR